MSQTHKTFFGKILSWIGDRFHNAEKDLVPVILPAISHILTGIKTVVENPLTSTLISFIPGSLPAELFAKLKVVLPKVAAEEGLVVDLATAHTEEDVNKALQSIFATVKWPTAEAKQKFLSSFGARVLQEIKDKTMTFAQAVIDLEYFYENYVKNPVAAAA